jgi:hypothetical protein
MTIFYCLTFNNPFTGGPGPCIYISQEQIGPVIPPGSGFISPRNRAAQLYPQALGSLFVASYDSARTALKTPLPTVLLLLSDVAFRSDCAENIVPLLRGDCCYADELFTVP